MVSCCHHSNVIIDTKCGIDAGNDEDDHIRGRQSFLLHLKYHTLHWQTGKGKKNVLKRGRQIVDMDWNLWRSH